MGEKGQMDYEIPDDPHDMISINTDDVPLCITIYKVYISLYIRYTYHYI